MWLMIMCVAGALDLISPIEPTPQPEIVQEEIIVEDVNDRENLGSSEEIDDSNNLNSSNSLETLNSSLELPPVPEDEKPSIEELLEKILEKLEKIEENSGRQLDEMEEFEKMIRKVVREEIENAFKEREQKKAVKAEPKPEPKPVEKPKPVEEPKQAAPSSEVTLYFYPMPGCEPCNRMKQELVTSNMGIPLMQGRYPCTFRDGTPVTTYPSAELMDGGKLVKRWVGYTPAYAIRDEYELYTLNQTR